MKLYHSASSPFVRKVMVFAHELGLVDRLELIPGSASPVNRDATLRRFNPLGQVPVLIADDESSVYDSRIICEHLNDVASGQLFGRPGTRIPILTQAALGDGLLGAALLARYEVMVRPAEFRWEDWSRGQMGKITDSLDQFELWAPDLGQRVDIGTVTFGCALGYLDFRFGDYDWRSGHPNAAAWFESFGDRPSMKATRPPT